MWISDRYLKNLGIFVKFTGRKQTLHPNICFSDTGSVQTDEKPDVLCPLRTIQAHDSCRLRYQIPSSIDVDVVHLILHHEYLSTSKRMCSFFDTSCSNGCIVDENFAQPLTGGRATKMNQVYSVQIPSDRKHTSEVADEIPKQRVCMTM